MKKIIRFTAIGQGVYEETNEVLFVRKTVMADSYDTVLEVPLTHEALLIKNGGNCNYYKSGTYDVFEDRSEFKKWRSNGAHLEVVYIPKDTSVKVGWAATGITLRDKASTRTITVGMNGTLGLSVDNAEQFFRKIVGVMPVFDVKKFKERFADIIANEVVDAFAYIVDREDLRYDQFDGQKRHIASVTGTALGEKFKASYGLDVVDLIIDGFVVDGAEAIEADNEERIGTQKFEDPNYEKYLRERERAQERESALERERKQEMTRERERQEDREWEKEKWRAEYDKAERDAVRDQEFRLAQLGNSVGSSGRNELSGEELYQKAIKGVICIQAEYSGRASRGSGFIIDVEKKLALTNTHVVVNDDTNGPANKIIAYVGDFAAEAKVLMLGDNKGGSGNGVDLALIQLATLPSGATAFEFRLRANVKNGETVYGIGNAKGEGISITRGIVSDKEHTNGKYIMTDCTINHGNSGGPLIDTHGNVIGVNTCGRIDADNMNFAIPTETVKEFVEGKHCAKKYF